MKTTCGNVDPKNTMWKHGIVTEKAISRSPSGEFLGNMPKPEGKSGKKNSSPLTKKEEEFLIRFAVGKNGRSILGILL